MACYIDGNCFLSVYCMIACPQIYAGIEKTGGFETENDDQHVGMVQMVISKCLEKEALCNEFFLQLIKQTTDQPGKSSSTLQINFFAMLLSMLKQHGSRWLR